MVTTVQARKAMTPVTIKCDASTLLVDGGVDSVRLLVGPSGEIEVLDADPALSDGSAAAIWHLSAGSPDVEIVVTNR